MAKKVWNTITSGKKRVIVLLCLCVLIAICVAVPISLAAPTPIKNVEIYSENLDYVHGEPGAWKVTKSAEWIAKGKAQITVNIDTMRIADEKPSDVIIVLDSAVNDLDGQKFNDLKAGVKELANSVLTDTSNRVALLTFVSNGTTVCDFTSDINTIQTSIDTISNYGYYESDYYAGLLQLEEFLKYKTNDLSRNRLVIFITDGYPTKGTPNDAGEYQYLKSIYPNMQMIAVQYDVGNTIIEPLKLVSDAQFAADRTNIGDVLSEAAINSHQYEDITITDYVNDEYFDITSIDKISVTKGNVSLEMEGNTPKITWDVGQLYSGASTAMTIVVDLHDYYLNRSGIFPTNKSITITSEIDGVTENVESTNTPIVDNSYQVIYEANAPNDCSVENLPSTETKFVYDTVLVSQDSPSCDGYVFKGWEYTDEDMEIINNDYFVMPEKNVTLRAIWGKVSIVKSMEGEVDTMGDPIMMSYNANSTSDYHSSTYKQRITSVKFSNTLMLPDEGVEESWDVSAAHDGSVIAYIMDDGSGNDTYTLTIGGQGGVIANEDSGYIFYEFNSIQSIDMTNFDTRYATNMAHMFENCNQLTSLDVSDFNTSNVTDMSYMFYRCRTLPELSITNFDTSKVTNMMRMFAGMEKITTLNLSSFRTPLVTDMSHMFDWCVDLTELDLSTFNTSQVTDMDSMFNNCNSLTTLNLGNNFDTSNVTSMYSMFNNCVSLTSLDVRTWNTAKVTNMQYLFQGCQKLTRLDVSNWNTGQVTNMNYMFSGCLSLGGLNLSSFDTSNVTSMAYMFAGFAYDPDTDTTTDTPMNLLTITFGPGWDTSKVTNISSMFYYCNKIIALDLSMFETGYIQYANHTFARCSSLHSINLSSATTILTLEHLYTFSGVNNNIQIVVGSTAVQSWVNSRLSESGITNATVTVSS